MLPYFTLFYSDTLSTEVCRQEGIPGIERITVE